MVLLIAWGTAVVADVALMSVPNYVQVAWLIAGKAHASWADHEEDLACASARSPRISRGGIVLSVSSRLARPICAGKSLAAYRAMTLVSELVYLAPWCAN